MSTTKSKSSANKPAKNKKVTPLMKQYFELKSKHPDAILLFRVGDFYETFGEDAERASSILNIVLTKRNNGGVDIALAGFPYHSLNVYLPRLVRSGVRVAICEQLEKPSKEKKIVKRGVTEVITPGLTVDDTLLDNKKNNFLASIHFGKKNQMGIAFLDISTGEFFVHEGSYQHVSKLLQSFNPSEVIFSKSSFSNYEKYAGDDYYFFKIDEWVFQYDYCRERLLNQFDVVSLKGFGIEDLENAQIAAGSILYYLESTENKKLSHINNISRLPLENYVWLDKFTIRNLELLFSQHPNGTSLIEILDRTDTPMGGRLLRKWMMLPLLSPELINKRLNIVEHFHQDNQFTTEFSDLLKGLGDFERLVAKVPTHKINPREVVQLNSALQFMQPIKDLLGQTDIAELETLGDRLNVCKLLVDQINTELRDEVPVNLNKGGVIRDGFNAELDEFRNIINNSKEILVGIQQAEAEKTGITNLKIGFNNVFGYYFEVTNKYKHLNLIPDTWTRKQTLTNAERYISEELKELESKILSAEEKSLVLEQTLFTDLVIRIGEYIQTIQNNAQIIAQLDILCSFAQTASRFGYNRPKVDDSLIIDIKNGRHPVIERNLPLGESYVPNDILINDENQQILMITGPNMSGKSALLRQTALICLMAQLGSYVPAEEAHLGVVDKIFTRVGASDNISSGESTFMVEMNETANIMNNLSARSLILLDEIGRGTSTYDGISIAWSIAEYLNKHPTSPKTLFATHYHELNELAEKYEGIKNFNVGTKEIGKKVVFLRKLKEGGSKHSFGIHVAKIAGMPKEILINATSILTELEKKSIANQGNEVSDVLKELPTNNMQLSIFDAVDETAGKLKEMLVDIDIHTMTPIECMMKLNEMKQFLESND